MFHSFNFSLAASMAVDAMEVAMPPPFRPHRLVWTRRGREGWGGADHQLPKNKR